AATLTLHSFPTRRSSDLTDDCGTATIYVSHTDGGTTCAPTRTFKIWAMGGCNNTSTAPAVVYSWKAATTGPTFTALPAGGERWRSEEHTSELQPLRQLVC